MEAGWVSSTHYKGGLVDGVDRVDRVDSVDRVDRVDSGRQVSLLQRSPKFDGRR